MPNNNHFPHNLPQRGSTALPHWGVIQAQGEEAAHFLHNQLTQDVLLLPVGGARLAAFCSAKGRMQASFIVIKTAEDTVLLAMNHDLLAQTLKRLSMFVLRAKLKLSDVSAQWRLRGLIGESARSVLGEAAPWQSCHSHGAWAIALYPARMEEYVLPRALWMAPIDQALADESDLSLDFWMWSEVMSGVTLINPAVYEAFVPQMLNYESVGGVNFKKGCYPGQEVVARSQFRGTLKRRCALLHSPLPLAQGDLVFSSEDPEQACGTVVLAAPRPEGGGYDALISGTLESLPNGWHLGHSQGAPLSELPLPYPLLDDI